MPTKLATLASVTLMLALSGCIEAAEFAHEMDAEFSSWEESWGEDMDEWEDDWSDHEHYEGDPESCPEDEDDEANSTQVEPAPTDDHDDASVNQTTLDTVYADAQPRFQNEVVGSEDTERNIRVNLFGDNLRIGLAYHLHGSVEISVHDPLGRQIAKEEFDGSKEAIEDHWVDIDDPLPGDYEIEIEVDGSGGYTIGVYASD